MNHVLIRRIFLKEVLHLLCGTPSKTSLSHSVEQSAQIIAAVSRFPNCPQSVRPPSFQTAPFLSCCFNAKATCKFPTTRKSFWHLFGNIKIHPLINSS